MKDPSKWIKAMQLRRSVVGIIGVDYDAACNKKAEEKNMVDGDPELLDDFQFFHQLHRVLLSSVVVTSDEALVKQQAKLNALMRQQNRKRKTVDLVTASEFSFMHEYRANLFLGQNFAGYMIYTATAFKNKDNYHWLTGRVDDVINDSGHPIGT
ncbi:hypothetical protein GIB67_008052 [Kingdonia uniflora]|uniref:Uncharacterized protein n=1 Tax=Kingdonia uniflora TaxID=39325 RepID=A0A7J7MNE3_9MAGN|nr:hypothetical protein GIB67_008052 [Kingdonia uniflora]